MNLTTDVLSWFGEKCQEAVKLCQNIPLSRYTITRRKEEINQKQIKKLKIFFYLESTDINNICQLLICTVDANLNCFKEIYEVVSLHGNATEQSLFDAIDSKIFSIVDKSKLASIWSDGAQLMRGRNKGLLGIFNKK